MKVGVDAHLVTVQPTGVGKAIFRTIEAMAGAALDDRFVIYGNRALPGRPGDNCRVVRSPLIDRSRLLRVLHERFVMPRRALRDKLNVFYAPGYVFPGRVEVPMVLGVFDVNALKQPHLVRPETAKYYKLALPASAGRARRIIVPTKAVADDVVQHLDVPADRVRVVPCAVDDRFRPDAADPGAVERACGVRQPYVLFVGNIEPNKNLGRLVEAFFAARLNCDLPHQLVIAGRKRHRAGQLTRLVRRLGCEDVVRFPGYVADELLPALYASADAFVYPSHAEGFGIPPLEAMRSGTPTITSEDAAVVEVTGDGAVHFAADDLAGLRRSIEKVLGDTAFAEDIARRGRAVAGKYDWAETGRRTLDVLREVAAGGTGRQR
jgi:glycosyltransferase involved in cell wall biosynthesis